MIFRERKSSRRFNYIPDEIGGFEGVWFLVLVKLMLDVAFLGGKHYVAICNPDTMAADRMPTRNPTPCNGGKK